MSRIYLFLFFGLLSYASQARTVVVAVIDTGIDFRHPHFENHIWQNEGESGIDANGKPRSHNGIDDDHNGYIDDVNGFNFSNNSPDIDDANGHGTHVSGIITGQDTEHAPALCKQCVIMPLKYYSSRATAAQNIKALVKAFHYARLMNAEIINYSGGGYGALDEEREALSLIRNAGIPVVAAAGNFSSNNDLKPYFPASYNFNNIISVGALNVSGKKLKQSNFGERSVHVFASGEKIKSALPGFKYGEMSGSSQAAAIATALFAQSLSKQSLQFKLNDRAKWLQSLAATDGARSGREEFKFQISNIKSQSLPNDEKVLERSLAQSLPQ